MLPKVEPRAAKVPEIGAMFWLIKIITTGIGETTSDFMGQTFIPAAALIGVGGLYYALRRQFGATSYHAPTYWFCVLMVAVFGTMAADAIHIAGLPYAVTTPLWAAVVAYLFWRWNRAEGTLSIHSITTRSRERYYWATVLATFALGTAAGDLTGIQLNMGFLPSGVFFAVVIAVPAVLWWIGGLNATLAFWSAYVVTRPLGASFADWFGKEHSMSGLGLGDGLVSLFGLIAFAALVTVVAIRKRDIQPHQHHLHPLPGLEPLGMGAEG
jgi:uncharacterized membrane-anchored protein